MGALAGIIMGLSGLIGIVSLICWIMVLIKMFGDEANGGVGKGIFGVICGLYAFIWGWQNAELHDIKKVMLAWTGALVGSIVLQIVAGAMGAAAGM